MSCCRGLLQCCHRHDAEKYVIEGTFEIDHSPWLCLSAARSVAIRIFSSEKVDPSTKKGLESENAYIMHGKRSKSKDLPSKVIEFKLKFEVVREFGTPGAFVVENGDKHEFFLKSAVLHYTNNPASRDDQKFHFYCNSWVYPLQKTQVKRFFFTNQLYIPKRTPPGLVELRKKELKKLQRQPEGERKPWDRIYDYACYNDLGDPDNGGEYARPILGGSTEYPYPRRLKTGRPPCHNDQSAESRPAGCFQIYVPPDERMSHEKQEELRNNFIDALVRFLAPKSDLPPWLNQECPDIVKKIIHFFVPTAALSMEDFRFILSIVDFFKRRSNSSSSHQNADSSDQVGKIFNIFAEKKVKEMDGLVKQKLEKLVPVEIFNEVVADATKRRHVSSQLPSIIAENEDAWAEDEEFGRQLLAGTNPVRIRLLKEFEPLDGTKWNAGYPGDLQEDIRRRMDEKKAFILDHHDYLKPFLKMINGKGVCAYRTRTILTASSTLDTIKPIAIELHDDSDRSMVVTPDDDIRWELAKIHVAANDAAYHQLVSHWLHTHAVVEPFIIATRRQLSVMHPIHRLLDPHFKDTLHVNALARAIFLNAGGILERTLFTGEFSMRLSSLLYKEWRFDEQALPRDLEKRGMAKKAEEGIKEKNASEIKEKPAEMELPAETDDEETVERDQSPAEIDENVVESDEKLATDKTTDEKVTFPAGVKLILEDYPYAKDGTEIWDAIETWVRDYCEVFYKKDDAFKEDKEIEAWWSEIRNEGHADQSQGWSDLETVEDLVKALTTLIWMTSGLHAAVNFGQYAYAGWPPNRPMLLRKFIPEKWVEEKDDDDNTSIPEEWDEEKDLNNGCQFIEQMFPEKFQMAFAIAVMDLLSRHTSDEVYLGQRPPENKWEEDETVNEKFQKFRTILQEIERNIKERNRQYTLMNRWGVAQIPYKLLYPDTSKEIKPPSKEKDKPDKMDINERGIPNSISI